MSVQEKTIRQVFDVEPGLFRSKTTLLRQEVNKQGRVMKELSRISREGDETFRLAKPGEAPTDELIHAVTYEKLSLVRVTEPSSKGKKKMDDTKKDERVEEQTAQPEAQDEILETNLDEDDSDGPISEEEPSSASTEDAEDEESAEDAESDTAEEEGDVKTKKTTAKKAKKTIGGGKKPAKAKKAAPKKAAAPKAKKTKTPKAKKAAAPKKEKAPKAKKEKVVKAKKEKAPKVAKPKKEKAVRAKKSDKPSSGQSGPALENFDFEKLNKKEVKVLEVLAEEGALKIADLAAKTFAKNEGKEKANSWVRNSLRRLVRAGLAEKADRGEYKATASGKRKTKAAA